MLNEDRIKLMTQMAAYEQKEGKEYIPMNQYYRKDYVGIQMIKTFVCSTFAFGIILLLQVLYEMDVWMERIYQTDLLQFGVSILIRYIIFVAAYQVIACLVYNFRYRKGHKSVKQYLAKLKRVDKLYEKEERFPNNDG